MLPRDDSVFLLGVGWVLFCLDFQCRHSSNDDGNNTETIQLLQVENNKAAACASYLFTLASDGVVIVVLKIVGQAVTKDIRLLVSEVEPVVVPA